MGDLLGYWRRENSAVAMKALLLSTAPDTEQMESPDAIARLKYVGPQAAAPRQDGQGTEVGGRRLHVPAAADRRRHQAGRDIDPRDRTIGSGSSSRWRRSTVARASCGSSGTRSASTAGSSRRRSFTSCGSTRRRSEWRSSSSATRCSPATRAGRPLDAASRAAEVRHRRGTGRRSIHPCGRRHLWVGDAPRWQLRADPGSAGHGQDVHRCAHHPHVGEGGQAGRGHGDEPSRDRQPDGGGRRAVRRGRRRRRAAGGAASRSRATSTTSSTSTTTATPPAATSTCSPARRGSSPARRCVTTRSTCWWSTRPASSAWPTRWRRRSRRRT